MTQKRPSAFWEACDRLYAKHPGQYGLIAQEAIAELLGDASALFSGHSEFTACLQSGATEKIKARYRSVLAEPEQYTLRGVTGDVLTAVNGLSHGEYFVPSVGRHLPVAQLVAHLGLLREAASFMHGKAAETEAEARRLDDLVVAVEDMSGATLAA